MRGRRRRGARPGAALARVSFLCDPACVSFFLHNPTGSTVWKPTVFFSRERCQLVVSVPLTLAGPAGDPGPKQPKEDAGVQRAGCRWPPTRELCPGP